MKKMLFGTLLFVSSGAILLTLFVLSFDYPVIYNNRDGFLGFLLFHKYLIPTIILIVVALFGISLCAIETIKNEE